MGARCVGWRVVERNAIREMFVYVTQLCVFECACRQIINYTAVCLQRFLKFNHHFECLSARKSNPQLTHKKQKNLNYSFIPFLAFPPIAYKRATRVTIFVKKSFYRGAVRCPTMRGDNACDANATVSCTCLPIAFVLYYIYTKFSPPRLNSQLITKD